MAYTPPSRIGIAIIGGRPSRGSSSECPHPIPHLDIQLFEVVPEFSERGAALGLAVNAQQVPQQITPPTQELLEKAGAIPMSCTRALLASRIELDRQYRCLGDGAFILHDISENRTVVQRVLSAVGIDSPKDRKRLLTREFLNKTLANWLDGPIAKGDIHPTLVAGS
ncbi:hypothetical protein F5Y13DRAFT_98988 [Hypoxylon sp. FL1857]|nr:hypothetical protein F5Y13DRAFT_98988 [Hypoxylon sp. FL1857]